MFLLLLVFSKYKALGFPVCWQRKSESCFIQYRCRELERNAGIERHQREITINLKNRWLWGRDKRKITTLNDTSKSDGRIEEEHVPVFPVL